MIPYHFDRGADGQFVRAADWQRNGGQMEGQVIARHRYVGHPPWQHSYLHSATGPGSEDTWINQVMHELSLGVPTGEEPNPDMDYVQQSAGWPLRYLSWRLTATVSFDGGAPTLVYDHWLRSGKHSGGFDGGIGGVFYNAGEIVQEHLYAYDLAQPHPPPDETTGGWSTYDYGLNDDGTFATARTGLFYDGLDGRHYGTPLQAVQAATTDFLNAHPPSSLATSATVTNQTPKTGAQYTEHTSADDGHYCDVVYDLTLSEGWSFNEIQEELDRLLEQVNLGSPDQEYVFELESTTPRKLNALGESVIVTHEGPTNGNTGDEADNLPLRYVFTSNSSPWNWESNGPCAVAENINDVVKSLGEGGGSGLLDNEGGPWEMMKSVVALPAGSYTKTVKDYQKPTPDTTDFPPGTPNNDAGGELLSSTDSLVAGSGGKLEFSRGAWITITKLAAGAPPTSNIDQDSTPVDQGGTPIDQ
jgi:hypothetical protein